MMTTRKRRKVRLFYGHDHETISESEGSNGARLPLVGLGKTTVQSLLTPED